MRISVSFIDAACTLAAVRLQPNLLERLLGMRERDDIAQQWGGGGWVWGSPFRPITQRRVVNAIELARRRCLSEPVISI